MATGIKLVDLTQVDDDGDSVAIIYFQTLKGTVHIYRDGTVILSSPSGTTVTSLAQPDDRLWRRTQFLGMLARMGVTDQALMAADRMIANQEENLSQADFSEVVRSTGLDSIEHFQAWCQQHGLDYETMDESAIEQLVNEAISQIRPK